MDPDSPEGSRNSSSRVRQRLKPWLEAQINSGRFPGLAWVNREERTFRITWKHGGRADWSETDALIFKVGESCRDQCDTVHLGCVMACQTVL